VTRIRGNSNKRTASSGEAKSGIESAGFVAPAVVLGKRFAVFGTNGEANSLSMEERAMLLDELVASGADPSA